MTPARREAILLRDGQCVIPILGEPDHVCKDRWGTIHDPRALRFLTIDHIKREPGSRRDDEWAVAMCFHSNVNEHWSSRTENRRRANEYLRSLSRGAAA